MFSVYQFTTHALVAISGYVIFTTIVGALHARIAKLLGDATAVYDGMGEFNPSAHFDIIGFILCMVTAFGWKKRLTLSIDTMCNLYKKIKIAVVEPALYSTCSFIMCCLFIMITRSSLLEFSLQVPAAMQVFLPGQSSFYALLAYALQSFTIICMAFSVMSFFSIGIDIIMDHFNYTRLVCTKSDSISLAKRIGIALPFIIAPLLSQPLLFFIYSLAYYCMKLFIVLQ